MAQNKAGIFDPAQQELAEYTKAFSHPARLAILRTLAERRACICGEIVDVMPLAQATVSQHLKELKQAGLIDGEIEGRTSCYCINWERIEEMKKALAAFFEGLDKCRLEDGCC